MSVNQKTAKKLLTYLIIVGLAMVCAVSYQLFVFPNRFAPAGLNGLCTMIQYLFGINVGYLSLLINIPLAILVRVKVGRTLAVRSMIFVVSFSLALILLEHIDLSRFAYETENGTSMIIGPLVAGIINGACYSLLVRANASSGGTDLIAAVIHRVRPEMGFFVITFALNVVVAISSYFVYDYEMEPVILCILYSFMSSTVSDRLMKSGRSALRCEIITDYPAEISDEIIRRLNHSATLIPGKGMYSGREPNMLVCIVHKSQVAHITAIIRKYPNTFAVMSSVSEVMGNFKHMDVHGKEERAILDVGDGHSV